MTAQTTAAPVEPEPRCLDCGQPISAHAARYRGAQRCRACANRHKAGTWQRGSPAAAEAARAASARRRRDRLLAEAARAALPGPPPAPAGQPAHPDQVRLALSQERTAEAWLARLHVLECPACQQRLEDVGAAFAEALRLGPTPPAGR